MDGQFDAQDSITHRSDVHIGDAPLSVGEQHRCRLPARARCARPAAVRCGSLTTPPRVEEDHQRRRERHFDKSGPVGAESRSAKGRRGSPTTGTTRYSGRLHQGGVAKDMPVGRGKGVAVGPRGVRVANTLADTLQRIDASTDSVTRRDQCLRSRVRAASRSGTWWWRVAENSGDGKVSRVAPQTNRVITTSRLAGAPKRSSWAARSRCGSASPPAPATPTSARGSTCGVATARGGPRRRTDPGDRPSSILQGKPLNYATCAGLRPLPITPMPSETPRTRRWANPAER